MSGGISFSSNKSWIVATWAYCYFIERVQKHISKDEFPKLHFLTDEEENPSNFIFVNELLPDEQEHLYSAIRVAYDEIVEEDGITFGKDREFYENFLFLLKELFEMLPQNTSGSKIEKE